MFRISILGSGKVAWNLAQALENEGHCIEEVWSRNPAHANALVDHLYAAQVQTHLDFSNSRASVFLISVTDAAVEEIARRLILPQDAIVAHTSGTLPMEVLGPASPACGVFYPLQTFSKGRRVKFDDVPFCLEATSPETFNQLHKLAASLSKKLFKMDSAKRKVLHLAAVFSCNFTNHMLRISEKILEKEGIDAQLLNPLIEETIEKSMEAGPENAQTGPAVRRDMEVVAAHIEELAASPQWAELYYLISQDIIRLHKEK